ncbi:50S ribosomal protein L24 [Candidatus Dojkabacteria bacterium]|uniref:Large ribosomal subunit protein uL24 n=1 Tax=Candidatus Dojkabacteria bacterium TaxID=2099670 RepID=A0A3M0Z233_9BACT|nr:MAG: 50S ribosomal protein L24 [Candidatus Dojkabacteria bacterium]
MSKIKSGQTVYVISGKHRGRVAKVLAIKRDKRDPKNSVYVYLEGINIYKKSVKPNPVLGIKGGFKEVHLPIHISNVVLYNPSYTNKNKNKNGSVNNEGDVASEKSI